VGQRTVLITGSSTGLGLETSLYLAERGFNVYATIPFAHERPSVLAAARERRVDLRVLQLDVTNRKSIDAAIDQIVEESGGIFGLVNNAGLGLRGCFEDIDEAEMRQLYEVNAFGVMWVTQRVLPILRKARTGRILTVTSVGGRVASFGLSGYCSTKFAMEGFGEALAREVAPFGIQSILIEPGIVSTPHWTVNRGTARRASDPTGPYYSMFTRHEEFADRRTAKSPIRPRHVAETVYTALTARQPRQRYVVGRPAALVVFCRRFVPEWLFERVYFDLMLGRVIGRPTAAPSPAARKPLAG
jgi:NAD(P)-dependent dehydrogenase (short-subunit alcohol dehydrogenase family)